MRNSINKKIDSDFQIWKMTNNRYHIIDGAGVDNCFRCKENSCYYLNKNNKYFRHFYLNDYFCFPKGFSEYTNHIICNHCNDFCKQTCFI